MNSLSTNCVIRQLGLKDYLPIWKAMQSFTLERKAITEDEIWFVEHHPVFTQGQAGKAEHLLAPGDIPVVQVDRGGQVTYHGPGQQVVYFLVDLKRKKWGVRQLVSAIEKTVIELLSMYKIDAYARADAPGVYVEDKKICSLGLKIKRGCSFHGLALNINMDKTPFSRINPCGFADLEITQLADLGGPKSLQKVETDFLKAIVANLEYKQWRVDHSSPNYI